MSWIEIDGRGVTVAELRAIIEDMKFPGPGRDGFRPSGGVLHCTGAPNLKQALSTPPQQRIGNLVHFFRQQRGWPSGPHAFVWPDKIWLFTPLNMRGTHSPSWNGTRFGVEMMGDYNVDDPTTGDGLRVYKNAVALFGLMYARLGIDPDNIKMHRDDPLTTHKACPGALINKEFFIRDVHDFMGTAGDLDYSVSEPVPRRGFTRTPGDTLNLRQSASSSSPIVIAIKDGTPLEIHDEQRNNGTWWCRVKTPTGLTGWCASRFIQEG